MIHIHDLPRKQEVIEMSEVEIAQVNGGVDNWLVDLATQQRIESEEYLQNAVDLGAQLGNSDDPGAFAAKQAESQSEVQMFKISQEAISTTIKSIGEGLTSVARKS